MTFISPERGESATTRARPPLISNNLITSIALHFEESRVRLRYRSHLNPAWQA
jgi:hypothetical protein